LRRRQLTGINLCPLTSRSRMSPPTPRSRCQSRWNTASFHLQLWPRAVPLDRKLPPEDSVIQVHHPPSALSHRGKNFRRLLPSLPRNRRWSFGTLSGDDHRSCLMADTWPRISNPLHQIFLRKNGKVSDTSRRSSVGSLASHNPDLACHYFMVLPAMQWMSRTR